MSRGDFRHAPVIAGQHVRLAPLERAHVASLAAAAADGALWNLVYTSVPAPGEAVAYVDAALAARDRGEAMPFVVLDRQGDVVGCTRYYDIDPAVPRLHIGYTWYAQRAQRTPVNSESKLLLLGHAFDALGCEVVVFETSHLNSRSQAAIERLGARLDGVLRAHMRHRDGSLRDTYSYSILRSEWPEARDQLAHRLGRA